MPQSSARRSPVTVGETPKPGLRICSANCSTGRASGIAEGNSCAAPLSQTQIGEALGMAIVTVNRTLQGLRRTRSMEFRGGVLTVKDWKRLAAAGDFGPEYLHLKRPARI